MSVPRFYFVTILALIMFLYAPYSTADQRSPQQGFEQKYTIQKITLGKFTLPKGQPYGSKDLKGVYWMTMGRGGLAIDDSGMIYVLPNEKVLIYDQNGKYKREIVLTGIDLNYKLGTIEVSSDGQRLYITEKEGSVGKYLVFNAEGKLIGSNTGAHFLRRSCRDIYFAEMYTKGQKTEMHALDKNLTKIKDLKTYYLQDVKLNQKPVGFFDAELNYYYMGWYPKVIKLGPAGNTLWEKKVSIKAEDWKLIGIDADSNLYALTSSESGGPASTTSIVKLSDDTKVMASITLPAEITAGFLEDTGDIQNQFVVTCDGNIYFIPNYVDAINPAFEYAYREYKKRGEYAIYKLGKPASVRISESESVPGGAIALKFVAEIVNAKKYEGDIKTYTGREIESLTQPLTNEAKTIYIKALRNEIYARHGRIFSTSEMKQIFESAPWYRPRKDFKESDLNEIEKKNVEFILEYEKKMGWK